MGETKARLISGFSLGFIYGLCINIDHFIFSYQILFFFFRLVLQWLVLNEFYNLYYESTKIRPHKKIGLTASFLIIICSYCESLNILQQNGHSLYPWVTEILQFLGSPTHFVTFVLLCVVFMSFFVQMFHQKIESALSIVAITLFGLVYISIPFAFFGLILSAKHGIFYIWFISIATITSDAMAYFMGRYFGKHKIGFAMSPNKTYEGYIGGFFIQIISLHLFYFIAQKFPNVPTINFFELTVLGSLVFIATALGDLLESIIKRDLKVKDSGQKVSGHGGFLDVADGLILTVPSFYFFYLILFKNVQ